MKYATKETDVAYLGGITAVLIRGFRTDLEPETRSGARQARDQCFVDDAMPCVMAGGEQTKKQLKRSAET
jgi:hypothetical protein